MLASKIDANGNELLNWIDEGDGNQAAHEGEKEEGE